VMPARWLESLWSRLRGGITLWISSSQMCRSLPRGDGKANPFFNYSWILKSREGLRENIRVYQATNFTSIKYDRVR